MTTLHRLKPFNVLDPKRLSAKAEIQDEEDRKTFRALDILACPTGSMWIDDEMPA